MGRSAVLILNFGGPTNLEEVQPFLQELFLDPAILPGPPPFRRFLAKTISKRRAPEVAEQYREIGGGSPLVADTLKVVEHLKARFDGLPFYAAMAYTPPFIGPTLDSILADGIDHLVCLALFPHYSIATTGSVFRGVAEHLKGQKSSLKVDFVPAWHDHPGYLDALAERMTDGLQRLPENGKDCTILFSAHGLPVSFIRKGDPYRDQVQQNVRDLIRRVDWQGDFVLAWQSRVGPVRWLGPSTDDAIQRLAAQGVKDLLVVPVSFVSDHIETLYEIDITYGTMAREAGIQNFVRTEALDLHPRFLDALEDLLQDGLNGRYRRRCVRCLLPRPKEHFEAPRCGDCRFSLPAFQQWCEPA